MKATIAVLCFLVAVAYAIVVEARMGPPIDDGPLNPNCEKPPVECLGTAFTAYVYNNTKGCYPVRLNEKCRNYGYYESPQQCQLNCLPAPGKQGARRN
uniref:Putative tick kunitz 72 n=1 Tax=Ixodes ricinus TaxID=34613 RepID=V5H957_IXORI